MDPGKTKQFVNGLTKGFQEYSSKKKKWSIIQKNLPNFLKFRVKTIK